MIVIKLYLRLWSKFRDVLVWGFINKNTSGSLVNLILFNLSLCLSVFVISEDVTDSVRFYNVHCLNLLCRRDFLT